MVYYKVHDPTGTLLYYCLLHLTNASTIEIVIFVFFFFNQLIHPFFTA